jgi:3-oxoacyl-[acyl-carrier protein] reductase
MLIGSSNDHTYQVPAPNMNLSLSDKVAVVTASSRGIGFAIAQEFMRAGASVAICARDTGRLDEARVKLSAIDPSRVFARAGDIADSSFLEAFVSEVTSHHSGRIDILVNNSGGPPPGETIERTDQDWLSALNNNFMSVVRMCRLVVPSMKVNKWGRIINLTSTAAREPSPGMGLSNATRAAVAAYSKTLAHELGPHGITVNTILTGGCMTERFHSLLRQKIERTNESIEDALATIENTIPVRHIATPTEFAQTILFLASDASSYLTGVAIPIDGGASKSVF